MGKMQSYVVREQGDAIMDGEPTKAPSILKQTPFEIGFYDFGLLPPGVEYFNVACARWKEDIWLVIRRRQPGNPHPNGGQVGMNDLCLCKLVDNKPTQLHKIHVPHSDYDEHQEDPRCLVRGGALIISYTSFRWPKTYGHQVLSSIAPDATPPYMLNEVAHIIYGNNGQFNTDNRWHEKNWTWFVHENVLHCAYAIDPYHIVFNQTGYKVKDEHWTETDLSGWTWGTMRGGTNPIRVGTEYISFFHSSIDTVEYRRVYYMGAYAFKAEPPFPITRYTRKPLLMGSQHDPRNLGAPLVVFPSGSIYENDQWFITMGINDCCCAWMKIPHNKLMELMT